jgi:hypothetical protein
MAGKRAYALRRFKRSTQEGEQKVVVDYADKAKVGQQLGDRSIVVNIARLVSPKHSLNSTIDDVLRKAGVPAGAPLPAMW